MSRLLRHRGPDDEGYALFGSNGNVLCPGGEDTPLAAFQSNTDYAPRRRIDSISGRNWRLALGHRRLSILDLSPLGHQPMTRDGRFWIVFNGEIYNYIELRDELRSLGAVFRTDSDTEVLLAAYERWGTNCLARFNGMWAFAIYDRQRAELFLARDRYGVKPLYYRVSRLGLAFASEIKAFTALPDWRPSLNRARAYDFLAQGLSDHTDETLFADVRQIRGGECVRLDLAHLPVENGLPVRRWYEFNLGQDGELLSSAAAAASVQEKLLDAVRLRLRADVPVGSCLSGGVDSSAIVCCVSRLLANSSSAPMQHTFTACSRDKTYDERNYAELVASGCPIKPNYVYPQPERLFALLDKITWHQDEPFNSTSIFAQWSVFEAAAHAHIKVMLDGQGSDEVFAGYHTFWNPLFAGLLRDGRILQCHREISATHRRHGFPPVRSWLQSAGMNVPGWLRNAVRGLRRRGPTCAAWLGVQGCGSASSDAIISVRDQSAALIQTTHLPMLLHWEDRDSMAHGIEARTPFLDYRLVEFALGLPALHLISDGWTKRILRESLAGVLPDAIRLRVDKKAFALPESPWAVGDLQAEFRNRLTAAVEGGGGLFTRRLLEDFEQVVAKRAAYDQKYWRVVSFDAWRRQFNVVLV